MFVTKPRVLAVLALCLSTVPAWAEDAATYHGDSGAFLAARVAEADNDLRAAARWYAQTIVADDTNAGLLTGSIAANMALGEFDLATDAANKIVALKVKSQAADFALMTRDLAAEDYKAVLAAQKAGRSLGSPLTDDLITAWANFGVGNMTEALAGFDKLATTEGLEAFGLYHKALALASAGDFEGADKILSGEAAGTIAVLRSGVIAHVQILSQLERNPDALKLLDGNFGPDPDPQLDELRTRLKAGEPVPFDAIRNARDGMAEVFFTVASALQGETEDSFILTHTRIATHLRPDHTDSLLTSANLLEKMGQFDLAVETYGQVSPQDPTYYVAEIGRADALYQGGQPEAAIEALRALTRSFPTLIPVQATLADQLRRTDKCAEAIPAYDATLKLVTKPEPQHWNLFFSRGTCLENVKDWARAEPDLRRALALYPGQPQILNYLGYSLVDRGEKLPEALSLIEQAVAAQPEAGYIIDSLAWAYFRLGRYDDALAPMEKASLLEPVDPVVTDHLGDVYWAVGRKLEAKFQWRRALSFEPDEKETTRIRRKLEVGLDVVLKEEGAPALKPVDAAAADN